MYDCQKTIRCKSFLRTLHECMDYSIIIIAIIKYFQLGFHRLNVWKEDLKYLKICKVLIGVSFFCIVLVTKEMCALNT